MHILAISGLFGAIFFLFGSIEILFFKGLLPGIYFILFSFVLLGASVWYLSKKDVPNRASSLLLLVLIPLELTFLLKLLATLYDLF